jgi:hypothetical protein
VRRAWGYVLFTLGVFLIVLSPLMRWYTTPRVAKAPYDINDTSTVLGSGRYFNPKQFAVTVTSPIRNTQIAKGNPAASNKRVAVISLFSRTTDLATNEDIDYAFDVYAMDRSTGYAVHCCGEKPRHEGVTLKFPFDTDRNTVYPFYDSTAHRAFPAKYLRTETLEGFKTYVFRSVVPNTFLTRMTVPGDLVGLEAGTEVQRDRYYRAVTSLWVEPQSGAIMKASQQAQQWLQDASRNFLTVLADTNLTTSDESVKNVANSLSTGIRSVALLKLTKTYIPLYSPMVGVVLLAAGLILLLRTRARSRPDYSQMFEEQPTGV